MSTTPPTVPDATVPVQGVGRIRHGLGIVAIYLRLGVLNLVQYRSDFVLSVVNAVITLATQITGLAVIFGATAELGGWGPFELLVLVGIHFLITGLIGVVVEPSMQQMMEGIRQGTFDFTLTKPADSQLLASVQVVRPQSLTDVVVGTGVIITGAVLAGESVGVVELLLFAVMLVAGVIIIYAFVLMLSTLAFWFVKLDNVLAIFQAVFGQAGRWPVTIFPGPVRLILTVVVPVAFAVTIPAQALTGRLDLLTALGAVGLALVFFVVSRLFWFFALRRYTGASA